jgi:hypothetical protein
MNTRPIREYIIFAPARISYTWPKERPSNKDDLHLSVTGDDGRQYYTGVGPLLI